MRTSLEVNTHVNRHLQVLNLSPYTPGWETKKEILRIRQGASVKSSPWTGHGPRGINARMHYVQGVGRTEPGRVLLVDDGVTVQVSYGSISRCRLREEGARWPVCIAT